MELIHGVLPDFDSTTGYGYGYGDGSGSGYGDGYGDGYGSGYGDGYGSGYGYGDGYGSGYGYGDGYGSGYGYGDGYGSGYGDGYGYEDGYGYGSGYGYGDGYGSGYGDGYGSGSGVDWKKVARAALRGITVCADAFVAFWKSDKQGRPCNGGSGSAVSVGMREKIDGPLQICTARGLHATTDPSQWKGDRLWIVALHGKIQFQGDKAAALEREFLCEVKL